MPPTRSHAKGVHATTAGTPARVAHTDLHNEAVVEGAHVNETPHAHEPPVTMLLPLWVLALMTMAVGVYTTFGGRVLLDPAGPSVPETAPGWLTPSAVGVAAAGIVLAWLTYQTRTINRSPLRTHSGRSAPRRCASSGLTTCSKASTASSSSASRASSGGSIGISSTAC